MPASTPLSLKAALALALCLAAPAAFAGTDAQEPTSAAAVSSKGWTNSDPRYPTAPPAAPQASEADTSPSVSLPYPEPATDLPQAPGSATRRSFDPRYPTPQP